ncbi:MAG: oxidoreductase [Hyphomicrobiales bacterium]|nr:MAG: oxidoreductase [Hyphomicrobiales bacterium]
MSKVAVVSGGGSGLGAAITAELTANKYTTVIVGRRSEALAQTKASIGDSVDTFVADLSIPSQASELSAYIKNKYGGVDVLINNAGGNYEIQSPVDLNSVKSIAESWTNNFNLNVLTTVLLTEALGPIIRDSGRIVVTSSIAAYRGSGTGSYAASKSALHPYVYDLSRRFGPRKITVNAIAPGYVSNTEFFGNSLSDVRKEQLKSEMLTGEFTRPEHIASLVGWLISEKSSQITGQIIQVNGGAEFGR